MTRLSAMQPFNFISMFSGEKHDEFRTVFYALMSDEEEDLDEAVQVVNENPEQWTDEFRYDLEGLRSFRQFYGRRMSDYTPEQRETLKAYDENWTQELVHQMLGYGYNAAPEAALYEEPTVH